MLVNQSFYRFDWLELPSKENQYASAKGYSVTMLVIRSKIGTQDAQDASYNVCSLCQKKRFTMKVLPKSIIVIADKQSNLAIY